jgi:hypothetical protein
MKDREKADLEAQKQMTKELEAMDKFKTKEDIKTKKNIEWKDPR